ncbi:hypothetical protein FisN_2Hh349 [Fistulifera solaris]|jgi:hypothetical protein|uniref:Uncharacterized protein n=1 Tax=Fistulifera solaris TaxID=1519565 RepID=A0A1Z5KK56_FISSO|nr:hypothetical protein FisN_2Hh349 [Fistulifera solaris]|eukprot:GAX26704.1 hypothetical protein FisN_2Hh349 [Fistulifera solaris]
MNSVLVLLCLCLTLSNAFGFLFPHISPNKLALSPRRPETCQHLSSFYGNFDEELEDDEEEDEEDDDDEEFDDLDVANFRTRMSSMFQTEESKEVDELIGLATTKSQQSSKDWARAVDTVAPGTILLANPDYFCANFNGNRRVPSSDLLARFGLSLPPPLELGPDRRADLLPVLLVVDSSKTKGTRAILLNRRTGHLLGDLEQPLDEGGSSPLLAKFCIQPLWFGGVDSYSAGLEMVHLCPAVRGAKQLTEDGLYWGGDPTQAQDAMADPSLERPMSGFDFKFFVQSTMFAPGQAEKEVASSTFFLANVSTDVIFKSRDRMGTKRAKPLWTEIVELMGGKYEATKNDLYKEGDFEVDYTTDS